VFLLKGYNDNVEHLELLKQAILKIRPDRVQLNTLDRPGAVNGLKPLTKVELEGVVEFLNMSNVEIIASASERKTVESFSSDIEATILSTIARRPSTLTDLHQILGIHINEINKYLGTLELSNKIKSVELDRGVFYELKNKKVN